MKKDEKIYLYGKNALREALMATPEAVRRVYLDTIARGDTALMSLLQSACVTVSEMKEGALRDVGAQAVHQGVIAEIAPEFLYTPLEKVLNSGKQQCFIVLDELQDPHNVGAIIRSAAAFGADAVLLPEHNQAPITPVVIKTSAGMVFHIPVVKIGNVNQTLRLLKDSGFWIYGLTMDGDATLPETTFDTSVVFVIGNEGEGIREKTLELCDIKISIPMNSRCESLNAAVAASVVLYQYKTKTTGL